MRKQEKIASFTRVINRCIIALVAVLIPCLPAVIRWFCQYRPMTLAEQTAVTVSFYCCSAVIFTALWNMDRLLGSIMAGHVFVRENVGRIRRIQWCCGIVSLICVPASFAYMPLIFLVVIMAFLCLCVGVLSCVMDAAVSIREENDLTI